MNAEGRAVRKSPDRADHLGIAPPFRLHFTFNLVHCQERGRPVVAVYLTHLGQDLLVCVVLDPVDGSTNASRGLPCWATSLCALDADGPLDVAALGRLLEKSGVRTNYAMRELA